MLSSERHALKLITLLVNNAKSLLSEGYEFRYHGISDPLAKVLGIEVEESNIIPDDGLYFYGPPPKILLDPTIGIERLNFTYFHEIMHHLIRCDDDIYSFIHERTNNSTFQITLESYCNFGAAEFLIPLTYISNLIRKNGFSVRLIEELEEKFYASKVAAMLQLAHAAPHDCRIVICEYGLPKNSFNSRQHRMFEQVKTPGKQVFVQYSANSPATGGKYRIGRNIIIPNDHIITKAYHNQSYETGNSPIPFRSGTRWNCACEAYYYKGRVYAVFNKQQPPQLKHQKPLFDLDDYTDAV